MERDWTEFLYPLWEGAQVNGESICFCEDEAGRIGGGNLLYAPVQILSVQSADLERTYEEGRDYRLEGRRIVPVPGGRLPVYAGTQYCPPYTGAPETNWLRTVDGRRYLAVAPEIQRHQLWVTYTHQEKWQGPQVPIQINRLPRTLARLREGKALTIAFLGDSITGGWEASGQHEHIVRGDPPEPREAITARPPYMPAWAELLVRQLRRVYKHAGIQKINDGCGGQTSQWGRRHAKTLMEEARPDLLILGFGMNQLHNDRTAFGADMRAIMETTREICPEAEFLLFSSMPPNTLAANFQGHKLAEQEQALYDIRQELPDWPIAVAPVFEMFSFLLKAGKIYPELTGNNVNHPNDFSARIYAQVLLYTLGCTGQSCETAEKKRNT